MPGLTVVVVQIAFSTEIVYHPAGLVPGEWVFVRGWKAANRFNEFRGSRGEPTWSLDEFANSITKDTPPFMVKGALKSCSAFEHQ
jgi:hypothetical protein